MLREFWKLYSWIHILASIYRNCTIIHKALVLDDSLQYVQCVHIPKFYIFFYRLCDFIRLNSTACSVQTTRCTMMQFSLMVSAMNWLCLELMYWHAISNHSSSYCIWNRYCQNHPSIQQNFLWFAWCHTVEYNRMPCSNNKMYDDVVFADLFRYQLTMFEIRILTELSRLLDTHIAYEIVT